MEPDFGPIDSLVQGYQAAQAILTANRLGVFACLGHETRSLEEIRTALGTNSRGTRMLCDALVSLSILEKEQGSYRNTRRARRFLLIESPESRVASLQHATIQCERWSGLFDAVCSGEPTPDERIDPRLQRGCREFAAAMADIGRSSAREVADRLNLEGVQRMLDVGAGPGVYAIEFARRWPRLRIDLMDDPETLEVARENLDSAGMSDRVEFLAGDVFEADLVQRYDLIFLSNLIHIYDHERNRELIARCAGALCDGGRICIKDFILDQSRTAPLGAALFALNMLVSTESGDCYTETEVNCWLHEAGLRMEESVELTRQSRLLIALQDPAVERP